MSARWRALAVATLAHAAGSAAVLAVAPLAPFILDGLALSRAQIGLLLPAVYLGGVLLSLPAGWLTGRAGVRSPLAGGLTLAGAAVLAASLADGFGALLALLLVGGFGFSALNPATGRAIIEWFPPRERGVAMGIKQAGLTVGGVVSAVVLPPVARALGWAPALAVAGGVAVLAGAVVAAFYRAPPSGAGATAGANGSATAGAWRLARQRSVLVVFACGLALSVAQASVLAYLVLFARETFGISPVAAARFLALAHLGGAGARLSWGAASDRLFGGRRRPGLVASALVAAAAFGLFALGAALPAALAMPLALVAGAGAFGWVGLYFALVAEIGGPRHAGLLTGVATAFAWSGMLVGPPLFGLLLELFDTYGVPWLLLAGATLAAAAALHRLPPLVRRD